MAKKSASEKPKSAAKDVQKKPSAWKEWTRSILIAVGIALVIRWTLGEPFKIPSGSMEPTLQDGDRIFVNKYEYGVRFPFNGFRIPFTRTTIWYADGRLLPIRQPERWDIVVFKAAEERVEKHTLVKRIIGLPGEHVHIEGGIVYADGVALEPPRSIEGNVYTSPRRGSLTAMRYGILADEKFSVVPEGHYLVLGDNSAHSRDGRYFGWLPDRNLLGRVSNIWWPIGRWRDFTGFTATWWWRTFLAVGGVLVVGRIFVWRSWKVHHQLFGGTVRKGEHLFVNQLTLGFSLPFVRQRLSNGRSIRRGELIMYHGPANSPEVSDYLLGRVAGMPGEHLSIVNGRVQIEGKAVDGALGSVDYFAQGLSSPFGFSKSKSRVPEDHFYLLLDESDGKEDSRGLGWIPKRDLIGPVTMVWWPLWRWRRIHED